MKRTVGRLADGREIVYFDRDMAAPPRIAEDTRDLPERPSETRMRRDPLTGEWIAMAAHRQTRTYKPPADLCPLCPSEPGRPSEIPESDYEVVVFENRFPSFAGAPADPSTVDATAVVPEAPASGRCEVVCFTPEHTTSFRELDPERVRLVVDVWADRSEVLSTHPGVREVFCFENRGEEIGVTLHHPHGQIYGYPFVTPRTQRNLDAASSHLAGTGRHVQADILDAERADRSRLIVETPYWTAFVPAAARWPVEVHIVPNRQVPDIAALTPVERDDFATTYVDVLRRLDALYDRPLPYIAGWHQAPVHTGRELSWLRLEVFSVMRSADKLKYLAGSESGMAVWVNDVLPEEVAQRLRDAEFVPRSTA